MPEALARPLQQSASREALEGATRSQGVHGTRLALRVRSAVDRVHKSSYSGGSVGVKATRRQSHSEAVFAQAGSENASMLTGNPSSARSAGAKAVSRNALARLTSTFDLLIARSKFEVFVLRCKILNTQVLLCQISTRRTSGVPSPAP